MISISLTMMSLLAIALLIIILHQYKSIKQLNRTQSILEKKNLAMESEVKALLSADIVFGRSISNLKAQLKALDDRQSRIENRRHNDGGYQHALKLLAMGSDIKDVINDCNVSQAEVELLANLQAYQMANTTK